MTEKSNFEKLAEELEVLAKSQPDDASTEEKVVAAADEAGIDTDKYADDDAAAVDAAAAGGDAAGEEGVDDESDAGGDDDMLGKSFGIETSGGEKVRAYDATGLLKAFAGRIAALEVSSADVEERREHLGKSLELISGLLKSQDAMIKSQAEKIESLQKSVAELGAKGVGRKSVVAITEKPEAALTKSEQDGMSRPEFLAKAEAAYKAGRISGSEIIQIETFMNRGSAVPEGIVSRVMGNQ